jgi:hypothetical protein
MGKNPAATALPRMKKGSILPSPLSSKCPSKRLWKNHFAHSQQIQICECPSFEAFCAFYTNPNFAQQKKPDAAYVISSTTL